MAAIIEASRHHQPTPARRLPRVLCGASSPSPVLHRPVPGGPVVISWPALAGAALVVLAVLAAVLAAALGAVAVGRGGLAGAAPPPASSDAHGVRSGSPVPAGAIVVTVRRGDTLWSIARRIRPEGEVRVVVDRLVAQHGSRPLEPGERLVIGG